MISVYLGAPIDSADAPHDNFKILSKHVAEVFSHAIMYNPLSAFVQAHSKVDSLCEFVSEVNTRALLSADLGLFMLTDTPSFGVPVEIHQRAERGLSTIIWDRSTKGPGIYVKSTLSMVRSNGGYANLIQGDNPANGSLRGCLEQYRSLFVKNKHEATQGDQGQDQGKAHSGKGVDAQG
jgi:hypothetical protein